jgi:hypothetical protein
MYQPTKTQIIKESFKDPDLPFFPSRIPNFSHSRGTKFLEVSSLNYDYLPMNLEGRKMLWIDLVRSPPPEDFNVDSVVKLHVGPNRLIQTTLSKYSPNNSIFQVVDIVGSRIVLNPYKGSAWLPIIHEAADSHHGWGHDMNKNNMSSNMNTTKYGYGSPVSKLEYYPDNPSFQEILEDATQLDQNYYRGSKWIPGWNC